MNISDFCLYSSFPVSCHHVPLGVVVAGGVGHHNTQQHLHQGQLPAKVHLPVQQLHGYQCTCMYPMPAQSKASWQWVDDCQAAQVCKQAGMLLVADFLVHSLLFQVPITFTIEGAELLTDPSAAVLVLNHQSSIDLMAIMEIWSEIDNAAPVAKKMLKYCGPFGLACWLCGCVFIDR